MALDRRKRRGARAGWLDGWMAGWLDGLVLTEGEADGMDLAGVLVVVGRGPTRVAAK